MQGIEKLIQSLQLMQKQKDAYVFPLDVASLENFLNGFRCAASACGCAIPRKVRVKAIESKGWKAVAAGPAAQMKAKGLSDEAILDELIEIEIEQLRLLAAQGAAEKPKEP